MELFSQIETERLIIRKFKADDWKDIHEYLSVEKVVHFEPYEPFTVEESKEEAVCRSKNEEFIAVCLKETGKVIGNLYFGKQDYETYELGYVFNYKYWHKGYACESARALMDYAFKEGKVRRIIASCNPKNENSWHLLERLKMRREGHLLQNIYFKKDAYNNPIWQDTYEYGILASEWEDIKH
ncbi:MAG: GNAT family N-acetyltransferase [Clostridiaceae bacterium]